MYAMEREIADPLRGLPPRSVRQSGYVAREAVREAPAVRGWMARAHLHASAPPESGRVRRRPGETCTWGAGARCVGLAGSPTGRLSAGSGRVSVEGRMFSIRAIREFAFVRPSPRSHAPALGGSDVFHSGHTRVHLRSAFPAIPRARSRRVGCFPTGQRGRSSGSDPGRPCGCPARVCASTWQARSLSEAFRTRTACGRAWMRRSRSTGFGNIRTCTSLRGGATDAVWFGTARPGEPDGSSLTIELPCGAGTAPAERCPTCSAPRSIRLLPPARHLRDEGAGRGRAWACPSSPSRSASTPDLRRWGR